MTSTEMGMGEGTLTTAARLVAGAHHDFDRMSGELDARIAGLRGQWAGAGGRAFFVLHQAWAEKQRVVVGALEQLEAALVGTERDVTAADDLQATTMTAFQSKLG